MIILSFSDIHGDFKKFGKISDEIKAADLIVLAGDITHFGKTGEISKVVTEVRKYNDNIFAVSGNCDYPEVERYLSKENLTLHGKRRLFDGIYFTGSSYSLVTPFNTPSEISEKDFKKFIEKAYLDIGSDDSVFVVHQPPHGTGCDILRNGRASGSTEVRKAIEKNKPKLCLTGHIHESPSIEMCYDTVLINPGPFFEGRYASVEIKNGRVEKSVINNI